MPECVVTFPIDAPVEVVWEVLDDYGAIDRWSPGVKRSYLTSAGPVGVGTTRYCAFAVGGATERIDVYEPCKRMTVNLIETFTSPLSGAVSDFTLTPVGKTTECTIHYSYTPNLVGRLLQRWMEKQLPQGIKGIASGLARECERRARESSKSPP